MNLSPGANAALPAGARELRVQLRAGANRPDLVVLCLDDRDRANGDDGVALWTQPRCAGGAVTIDVETATARLDLGRLDAGIVRALVVAQADGPVSECGSLAADVVADGAPVATATLESLPAFPTLRLVEVYRRAGEWKVRCLGDGYADGLARLLEVHGIEVADDAPPAAPEVRPTPGEERLPVDMRKRLSMRKAAVAVSLEKAGATGVRARVVLVLDASGSMSALYGFGTMAAVVERMVAVAAQLDDDGTIDAWTFATNPARLPSMQVGDMPTWIPLHVRVGNYGTPIPSLFGRKKKPSPTGQVDMYEVGILNDEPKVIRQVVEFVDREPLPVPTLVLFFSDGGVHLNDEIEAELRAAAGKPIFWQFVGLGAQKGYGVLERLDTLEGRQVDNTGFFAVDDIDQVEDGELYDRLLSEFPSWLRAARAAGIAR